VTGKDKGGSTGLDWGLWGGLMGRECCIWAQLQRDLRACNLMPEEAVSRMDTLKFVWDVKVLPTLPPYRRTSISGQKKAQITFPLRHFFPLKVVPLIEVLLY
jgi:hypothetical protein